MGREVRQLPFDMTVRYDRCSFCTMRKSGLPRLPPPYMSKCLCLLFWTAKSVYSHSRYFEMTYAFDISIWIPFFPTPWWAAQSDNSFSTLGCDLCPPLGQGVAIFFPSASEFHIWWLCRSQGSICRTDRRICHHDVGRCHFRGARS